MVSGLAQADAEFLAALRADRLIAIVRGTDRSATVAATLTLLEEGVANVEISLSGTDALAALAQAIKVAGPEAYIGAGTVLTGEQAHAAHDVGARFVVTPALGDGVSASRELGLPVLAGALTPSEIVTARAAATAVKLFPASYLGVGYLSAVLAPLPDTALVPVGGVDERLAVEYLAAGAIAVGVGSPLLRDAADSDGDVSALRRRARRFRAAIAS